MLAHAHHFIIKLIKIMLRHIHTHTQTKIHINIQRALILSFFDEFGDGFGSFFDASRQ